MQQMQRHDTHDVTLFDAMSSKQGVQASLVFGCALVGVDCSLQIN